MAEDSRKNVAQAQFARLQRANDAKQAMADYEAQAVATRAKTARLRALRLARDADLAAAAAAAAPTPKKTKAARKPKGVVMDTERPSAKAARRLPPVSTATGGPIPGVDLTDGSALQEADDLHDLAR